MQSTLNNNQLLLGRQIPWTSNYSADISGTLYTSNSCALAASGGYVGIGKSNPQYALDISGTTQYSIKNTSTYNNLYGSAYYNTPYNTAITANTPNANTWSWINNNVSWTATASTNASSSKVYSLFDTSYSGPVSTISNKWDTSAATYNTTTPFTYIGTTYNTSMTVFGTIYGEWVQLQSSVPLVMNSFTLLPAGTYTGATAAFPKTFLICGSSDGNNWYHIVYCNYVKLPFAVNAQTITPSINITTSGTATQNANSSITGYPTATSAYTYFRMIITSVVGNLDINGGATGAAADGHCTFAEWTPTFSLGTQSGPTSTLLYMDTSNINQLDVSGSLCLVNTNAASLSVVPHRQGYTIQCVKGNGWINNNITWQATYSTVNPGWVNYIWNDSTFPWQNAENAYALGIYTSTISTTVNRNGSNVAIYGDYIQIQSSIPLIMTYYTLCTGGNAASLLDRLAGVYTIAASNDNSNWFAILDASFISPPTDYRAFPANLFTSAYSITPPSSGATASTQGANSMITYSAANNSYTSFRLIVTKTIYALANSGSMTAAFTNVLKEWGTGIACGWFPTFNVTSSSSSAASLVIDDANLSQLNIGGSVGLLSGITPLYLTPNFTPNQIGYSMTTYITSNQSVSSTSTNIASITNVPAGIWFICYICAFNNSYFPQRIGIYVGTVSGGADIYGPNYLRTVNGAPNNINGSIVYNNISTNTFYLNCYISSGTTTYTGGGGTESIFQVTRIA